jgi:hypothetical protein
MQHRIGGPGLDRALPLANGCFRNPNFWIAPHGSDQLQGGLIGLLLLGVGAGKPTPSLGVARPQAAEGRTPFCRRGKPTRT